MATSRRTPPVKAAAKASAFAVSVRYGSDAVPGISRRKTRAGFRYTDAEGKVIRDAETLARVRALAVPPAWTDVWIAPTPSSHVQATGRDARGRKQYRYHPRWRQRQDSRKYERLVAFGRALPRIRRAIERDLGLPGLPREKVLAAATRILDTTFLRVGSREYASANGSFGLTTLRSRHVEVAGDRVSLQLRGKGGKRIEASIQDRRVARVLKRCDELPGRDLFQYVEPDGQRQAIDSGDLNDYVREISGGPFTAKDFRTWAGTVLCARALAEAAVLSDAPTTAALNAAIAETAAALGNTATVCKNHYIHPAVMEAFRSGRLVASNLALWRAGHSRRRSAEDRWILRLLAHPGPK